MRLLRLRDMYGLLLIVSACGGAVAQDASSTLNAQPQFSPRPRPRSTAPSAVPAVRPIALTRPSHAAGPGNSTTKFSAGSSVGAPGTADPARSAQTNPQTASPAAEPPAPPAQPPAQAPPASAPATPAQKEATPPALPAETDRPFYILHAGDTVDVLFRYTPEFNDEVVIGPDGRASLKSTGDIVMAGRTLPELQRLIVSGSSGKLVNPEVAVSLKDFERPNVVVAGEVANPQRIELRRPTTALQAILIAGGPKDDAALGRVLLFRRIDAETAEVHVLHLGKYDAKTRAVNDLLLEPNDMILVRHDNVSRIDRYVKLVNLGVYLNPIGNNGVF